MSENYLRGISCELLPSSTQNAWPAFTRSSHMNYRETTAATVGRYKLEFRMSYKQCRRKKIKCVSVKNFENTMSL